MIQFYAPEISDTLTLGETDSAHAVRVLRMRQGDEIQCVDGLGHRFRCRVTDPHPKHLMVEILERESVNPSWGEQITLAVAPTKNMDRMEWLAEKAVEIGINRFVPLLCEHSERKVVKPERLERIMISAMKQSLKATLPQLEPLTGIDAFAREADAMNCAKFVGYCSEQVERRNFADEYVPHTDVIILIGPEGDFSPREIETLQAHGFVPVTFGNNRLRTETAALYGLTAVHVINSRNS